MKPILWKSLILSTIMLTLPGRVMPNPLMISGESPFQLKEKVPKGATQFVNRIDSLGYFKYTDSTKKESVKSYMAQYFDINGSVESMWDENTFLPLDFRNYSCDGEAVFEMDGFTEILNEMKPTFEKMGFKLSIDNHFEEWDETNDWLNHRITLNGTEYVIFKNFMRGYGWGEAVQRLAEILNAELEKQGLNERAYLISGGNDGRIIYLTPEIYRYMYQVYTDPMWKPLEVSEWVKVMQVEPMKLD